MVSLLPHPGRFAVRLGALVLALGALSGCQSIDVNAGNMAQLRFIQASPDTPGIDFYANNAAQAYNVGFGYGTSYILVPPGTYTITADQANTRTVLAAGSQSMLAGHQYTAVVGNTLAGLQETILTDQTTPAPSGEVAVRFVDQLTRVGAVDVYLVPGNGKLTATPALVSGISFGANTGYIDVPAGAYGIAVVPAGTVPAPTTATLLTGSQAGYATGSVRTVVLMDQQVTTSPSVAAAGVAAYTASEYESQ